MSPPSKNRDLNLISYGLYLYVRWGALTQLDASVCPQSWLNTFIFHNLDFITRFTGNCSVKLE